MKRFCFLAVLMLLGPSAYAGETISFLVGGHRVQIERPGIAVRLPAPRFLFRQSHVTALTTVIAITTAIVNNARQRSLSR